MTNLIDNKTERKNYDFINAIRGIAMMFIVMEHSIYFQPSLYNPVGFREFIYCTLIQISKFGTIIFFVIAGFLIGEKFTDYTPSQYLKRRLDSTIWPWVCWSVIFIVVTNYGLLWNKVRGMPDAPGDNAWLTLFTNTKITYLYTIYWFIPNFLFCITLLLVFKKYLYNYFLGATFALFTLFYAVNIYFSWIQPGHTTAIFGFVFFLWFGAQLNKNWDKINTWINRTSLWVWWPLTIVTLLAGVVEISYLKLLHNADPYNSLRITNILFSLSCFFLLLKRRNFKMVNSFKPRETTYGVYLIHYILVISLLPAICDPLNIDPNRLWMPMLVAYQLLRFLIVYVIVITIVKLLNKTKLKWIIGR
jgi:hypothetical protein